MESAGRCCRPAVEKEASRGRDLLFYLCALAVGVSLLLAGTDAVAQVPTNAVGYWKFDEGSGATAQDSSGYGHAATIQGAVFASGISNYALSFNGSNSYVFASDALVGGAAGAGLDVGARD